MYWGKAAEAWMCPPRPIWYKVVTVSEHARWNDEVWVVGSDQSKINPW